MVHMATTLFLRTAAPSGPAISTMHGPPADLAQGGGHPAPGAAEDKEGEGVHYDIAQDFGTMSKSSVLAGALTYLLWCLGFLAAAAVIGLLPAILVFMLAYMRLQARESWATTLGVGLPIAIGCYLLFHLVLIVPWPQSLVGELFPVLRTTYYLNLF